MGSSSRNNVLVTMGSAPPLHMETFTTAVSTSSPSPTSTLFNDSMAWATLDKHFKVACASRTFFPVAGSLLGGSMRTLESPPWIENTTRSCASDQLSGKPCTSTVPVGGSSGSAATLLAGRAVSGSAAGFGSRSGLSLFAVRCNTSRSFFWSCSDQVLAAGVFSWTSLAVATMCSGPRSFFVPSPFSWMLEHCNSAACCCNAESIASTVSHVFASDGGSTSTASRSKHTVASLA
mmetsp:Transcript_30142/g.69355  ORF Transcript_30142/g.69355 Transcript_30142/m.69355 type:complete len:234 (-) Transcript_30142:111-812(-)